MTLAYEVHLWFVEDIVFLECSFRRLEVILFAAFLSCWWSELSMETGVGKARKSTFYLQGSEVPVSIFIIFHFSVNILQYQS